MRDRRKNPFCLKSLLVFFLLVFWAEALPVQDEVIFGRPGNEGELIFPRQIEEGPDGNIYIYDQMDAFIKTYDVEGTFIGKIGGKGQGPGEIQRADGVSFGFMPDGKLFFTEFFGGHPWISVMETSGEFVRAVKLGFKERAGIQKAQALSDGRFVAQILYPGQPQQAKDYFLHRNTKTIATLDSTGNVLSRILERELATQISFFDQGGDSPIPFIPGFFWGILENDSVLFSEGLSQVLQVYDRKGALINKIETELPEPEKVSVKDLEEWRKGRKEMMEARNPDWYSRMGNVIEQYKKSIYKQKPNISGLEVTPEGNLLLTGPRDEKRGDQIYWLIGQTGEEKAQIRSRLLIGRLTKTFIFFAKMNEDGEFIVYGLKRQDSEEQDLLRIPKADI